MVRARRGAVALAAALLGLTLTAGPAAANNTIPTPTTTGSTVWVGVNNGGPGNILVAVTQSSYLNVNITSGCGEAPPTGVTFSVCLPGGGFLAFSTSLPPISVD